MKLYFESGKEPIEGGLHRGAVYFIVSPPKFIDISSKGYEQGLKDIERIERRMQEMCLLSSRKRIKNDKG